MDRFPSSRALLVFPRFSANSFWNYQETCGLAGARYPAAPLGLITVAALLPRDWEIRLVDRNAQALHDSDIDWADVVMTGGMLPQQLDTLRLIDRAHARGRPVVVGGPDASSSPDVYAGADFLVVGEAEEILSGFVADWTAGVRRGTYRAQGYADITRSPVPRFDLLDTRHYLHVGVQYSRGCPHNCEFCDVIELYGRVPRVKTSAQMLGELEALRRIGYRGHVDFVDDNMLANRKALKSFLADLRVWLEERDFPFEFTTEATIDLADHPDLLGLMRDTGFFAIFVGIESPDPETLLATRKRQNLRRVLSENVRAIYEAGIWVNAGFILGFDSERGSVAEGMIRCIEETTIPVCMVGLLAALPNTQLTRRLRSEGRLFPDNRRLTSEDQTDQCTAGLNFVTARPRGEIFDDYRRILDCAYSPGRYFRRVRAVGRALDCSGQKHRPPIRNALRDLRAFGRMTLRMGVLDREILPHFWKTFADTAIHNPKALKRVMALVALYLHLGPFAHRLSARLREESFAAAHCRPA